MKKGKIILINPVNPDPAPNYFGPPYGLSLIGASLLQDNRNVLAYDYGYEPYAVMIFSVNDLLKKEKPEYIGITVQSSNRGVVYNLIKTIKDFDKTIKIILGGVFATNFYELILRHFSVDVIVLGEGEETIVELLNALDTRKDLKDIKGIAYKEKRHIFVTEKRGKNIYLNNLPYPAFHLFKDFENKINHEENGTGPADFIHEKRCTVLKNALMLISSRGCIYACNFCSMSKAIPPKIRFHSPLYFINMLEFFYKKYHIRDFIFGDNFFTLERKRVLDICMRIEEKKIKIRWSCMTRPDFVDEVLLEKMSKAGCFEISFGVESGSEKIQKRIGKNLDLLKTKKTFQTIDKAGIRAVLMLMIANTGETYSTVKETLCFIKGLDPDMILVKTLQVYPDTKIHDIFQKKGLFPKDYYLTHQHQAPFFTLEHPLSTLELFHDMIQTRTTFIQLLNGCNNRCLFCASRKNNAKDEQKLSDLIDIIKVASTRGDRIYLFGGEPFLNKNFHKILETMRKLEIHHVYLQSNARIFSLPKKLMMVSAYEIIRRISIPFFGLGQTHDLITRTLKAFEQTMDGVRNLKKYCPQVILEAQIIICKRNTEELRELIETLLDLGVDVFRFVFFKNTSGSIKINIEELPHFPETSAQLRPLILRLNKNKKEFILEGFPFCVFKKYEHRIYEFNHLFDDLAQPGLSLCQSHRLREDEKIKVFACEKCENNTLCEGIWKEYIFLYGKNDFKTLTS